MPQQQILKDEGILKMIIDGYSSAYAIHKLTDRLSKTDNDVQKISYKNINVRLTNLAKFQLIEETKIGEAGIHGRKDYRVTIKGLKHLTSFILSNPRYMKTITEYIDKSGLDRDEFEKMIQIDLICALAVTNLYYEASNKKLVIPLEPVPHIQVEIPKPKPRIQARKQTKGMEKMRDQILTEEWNKMFQVITA